MNDRTEPISEAPAERSPRLHVGSARLDEPAGAGAGRWHGND